MPKYRPTQPEGEAYVSGFADVNLLRYANVLLLRADSVLCPLWLMKWVHTSRCLHLPTLMKPTQWD
jgi:hypothetical protein